MSIGIILGKSLEVFFSIAFFLGVRRIAGGRHCRTNVACFIISLLTICGSVIIAYFINEYFICITCNFICLIFNLLNNIFFM